MDLDLAKSVFPLLVPELPPVMPKVEETPIPYSPEGWEKSKIMKGQGGQESAKKKAEVGFTPEQMAMLAKLTTVETPRAVGGGGGGGLGRPQVGQMQQLQAGNIQTAPRSSLGQIIYGGRKF